MGWLSLGGGRYTSSVHRAPYTKYKLMHQKFSRRTCSQWTPVNKRYIALCVFYFFDNQNHKNHKYIHVRVNIWIFSFICHLPFTVECMLREESPPSCPFEGLRSPTSTFGGWWFNNEDKVQKFQVIIRCLLELQQKSFSQYGFSLFHLGLDEIGGEAEEVWCFTGYGETTCAS